MNQTLKKYLISSGITFTAAFCIAVLPQIDSISLETLKDGALVGLLFAGFRAGIKALIEGFIAFYNATTE